MSGGKNFSQAPEASTSSAAPALGLSDLRFLRVLGAGSFGKVWLARNVTNDTACAVKVIRREAEPTIYMSTFDHEVELMKRAGRDCPYLIHLIGHFVSPTFGFLVMDYHACGDLSSLLPNGRRVRDIRTARYHFAEVACAVQHLHDLGVIHRDIKLENIVMGADGHLRLIDLGLGEVIATGMARSATGTPYTMAPEVLLNKDYDLRADWYSLGIVLHRMVVGPVRYKDGKKWRDDTTMFALGKINFPTNKSARFLDLLRRLLARDPNSRLASFDELLGHQWFKKFTRQSVLNQHRHKPLGGWRHKELYKLSEFDFDFEEPEASEYRGAQKIEVPATSRTRRPKRKNSPEEKPTEDNRKRKRHL